MGIFDRLGSVINSYLNDFGDKTNLNFRHTSDYNRRDPDFDAAYEELNDYLNDNARYEKKRTEYTWRDAETKPNEKKQPPDELRADFEILNVPFGADEATCKASYKKLLKIHHPDHHTGHEGNYKKATEKSAKINAAWDRIEKWRQLEKK